MRHANRRVATSVPNRTDQLIEVDVGLQLSCFSLRAGFGHDFEMLLKASFRINLSLLTIN